ncbi:Pleckstrin homology domain [Rhizoctonia solani]|uniref:Pleckstrin homology domain n=1 Tax=Rhizoctonia solani TaxID=456999 RepID=A0A8H7M5P8_9AGAM|nr:Pleckstrin homology domain [Rhizoctonia solani]
MLKGGIDNDRVSEELRLLSETGTSPLRIQKGSSRSPSPQKDAPLPSMHPPIPYTLKTRKTSNSSSIRDSVRRTSSSYSAMRTNSLVKNSPFLNGSEPIGPTHRPAPSGFNVYRNGPAPPSARSSLHISMPSSSDETAERTPSLSGSRQSSKIPAPSRTSSTSSHSMVTVPLSSDEGSSSGNTHRSAYRRRQSKGLAALNENERRIQRHTSPTMGERESDWEELGNPSPELPPSTQIEPLPDLPEIPSCEEPPEPMPMPIPLPELAPHSTTTSPSPKPDPKPSLSTRLAAVAARAKSPPPSTPARSTVAEPPTPDVLLSTPPTIHTFPLELPETPGSESIYRTPLTPSQALPDAESTPIKANTSASSLIIHTDIPVNTTTSEVNTPTSPSKSPPPAGPEVLSSPRTSVISTGTDTSGISRTSSGRLVSRRGSTVARKNSRVARKASAGKYVSLARRSSRRSRKKVTFDERCDVLEYDTTVGIDGEAWSDGEEEEGEWETEEAEVKTQQVKKEGSRFTSVSPPRPIRSDMLLRLGLAPPADDANVEQPGRVDEHESDDGRDAVWNARNGPGVMPPSGSMPNMPNMANMPNMPGIPTPPMPGPGMPSSSSMPNIPSSSSNKYANLGMGARMTAKTMDWTTGRDATRLWLERKKGFGCWMGARRDSTGRRDSNTGIPTRRDSNINTTASGRRDSLTEREPTRFQRQRNQRPRDSNSSMSKYGPNASTSRIPARSSLLRNSLTGTGARPASGPGVGARPRVPGRTAGEGSRDSYSRFGPDEGKSDSAAKPTVTDSISKGGRKASFWAAIGSSNLGDVDSFGSLVRASDLGSFGGRGGKLVIVNPEAEDEEDDKPLVSEDQLRAKEEEKREREEEGQAPAGAYSVFVWRGRSAIGVGCRGAAYWRTGRAWGGSASFWERNGPGESKCAFQLAASVGESPVDSVTRGDISLATGMSFASLVSFDSIISRNGRIDESAFGEQSRIDEEDEEEDEEMTEDVSIDLGTSPPAEEESKHPSPRLNPEPRIRSSRSSTASPTKRAEGLPIPPTHSLRHLSPGAGPRHIEPQFTGGSVTGRSPRISRMKKGSPRASGQASPRSGDVSPTKEIRRGPRMSGARMEIERLMAGVERGFADNSGEGSSLGFNIDDSHSSLPYRRNDPGDDSFSSLPDRRDDRDRLDPESVREEEEQQLEPEPEPEPELSLSQNQNMNQSPSQNLSQNLSPSQNRFKPLRLFEHVVPIRSANSASGETETETEEAVTPPLGRSYAGPSTQRSNTNSRPNSYMSVSSSASSKPEMSGRERIKAHEEMILQKRRELRGGPSKVNRRRSKSTSETRPPFNIEEQPVLDVPVDSEELALEESFNMQLRKIYDQDEERTYHLREPSRTIRADDKVAHHRHAGDVDSGKAWRTVRRPSDMNEYAKEIQEIRAQAGSTKAHGKVFVKAANVLYLYPQQRNSFRYHSECPLEPNALIDQEFELIEHGKLAFSLTIKVRKDPHIIDQIRHMAAPSPQQFMPAPPPPRPSGLRGFFSSTPKKQPKQALLRRPTPVMEDHLVRYMKADGSIGAHISTSRILSSAVTLVYTRRAIRLSVNGLKIPSVVAPGVPGSMMSTQPSQRPIGELVLHIFRLPPLPGVPQETLPQSLEECHRGLSAVAWHKKIYYQGLLTQNGGDITSWRRRQFRIIGSNLIAYNDVTGKAIATISLKQALAVEDDQNPSLRVQFQDAGDGMSQMRTSATIDASDYEEKAEWLRILRALVGNIPPHPLWAELVWQRHEQAAAAQAQAQAQQQAQQAQQAQAPEEEETETPQQQPQQQVQSPRSPVQHLQTQYGQGHKNQPPIPQMWQPRAHSLSPSPTQRGRNPPPPPSKAMPPPPAPLPIPRSQAWR